MTRLVILAVVAVALAFLAAAGEAALGRVSTVRAHELLTEERPGSKSLVKVVGDRAAYVALLSFIRVLGEVTAAVMVTFVVVNEVDQTWSSFALAIAIMTVVSFVVVGVSPRTIGAQNSGRYALVAAPVAVWLRRVLGPVSALLVLIGNAVTPGKGFRDGPFASESELRALVDVASDSELIEADERRMIHSVIDLGDTITREVMVPRTDMVVIDRDKTCRQGLNLLLRSGYSRIPVVGEDTDDIIGMLYLKDVARRVTHDPAGATVPVEEVMRPAAYVPDSKPADDLLKEMQRDRVHVAIVVDEYGGTAGLVTIEDILEEIVGEIADEYDREDPAIEALEDGTWRVDATMDIDDLADHLGVAIEDDEVDTVGGLIAKLGGRVPILGSTAEIAGLKLTAERMEGRRHRIATVIIERLPEAEDEEGDR
ncbi:hemolysin family protein [Phycicoccus elongatus]|uniref:hemolysin family protein n=1 Tax=Phycicoccus elongatus TaxID=101689 RepID=UPI002C57A783|nr:HlyC/CorC family transporter [Tetrasphaera sp.]HOA66243.1 hemolysin family protein [Phycicoccus elongatus]HRC18006.1 hemolysin family protein [Phycicoccus elongatus]